MKAKFHRALLAGFTPTTEGDGNKKSSQGRQTSPLLKGEKKHS
jgi:hypothetical protein